MAGERRGSLVSTLGTLAVGLLAGALFGGIYGSRLNPRTWFSSKAAPAPPPPGAPVRLEGVMGAWRAAAGTALNVVGVVAARPANAVVERLQAAALRPVVNRLLVAPEGSSYSSSPPLWARTELTEACKAVLDTATFGCPTLHVVVAEAGPRIATLPVGFWKRSHRIFVSRGLLEGGVQRKELRAIFARELAHIDMGHWQLPSAWAMLQASGVYDAADAAAEHLPPQVEELLLRSWSQVKELCRAHSAVAVAAARARLVPEAVEVMPSEARSWLELEAEFGGAITEICELVEALASTSVRIQALWSLLRRAHVTDMLVEPNKRPASGMRMRGVISKQAKLQRFASRFHVEPDQVFGAVSLGARTLLRRPILLMLLAVKRTAELAADRMAAEAVGSVELVVAGLVRLYGSKEERRRLDRGDVQGIVESARAALSARGGMLRWELWWQSLVSGPTDPPLLLRIADLAIWAEHGEQGLYEPWRWARDTD